MDGLWGLTLLWAEMQRRGWFPLWLALLLGIAAVVIVIRLYVREAGRLSIPARTLMALIRIAIVLLIAFLLLRPAWVTRADRQRPRPIAVLIDISQSMGSVDPRPNTDDQRRLLLAWGLIPPEQGLDGTPPSSATEPIPTRPSRLEIVKAALANPKLNLLRRLARKGPLEVYTFGTQRQGRSTRDWEWLDQLKPDEPQTALADAVMELLNRDEIDAPAAIVLITDGRDNASSVSLDTLGQACARRNIPLHIYGVGVSTVGHLQAAFGPAAAGDAVSDEARAARGVDVPNTLFVDDVAVIPFRYTVFGVPHAQVDIQLRYGERLVAQKTATVQLTPAEQQQGKTFADIIRFVPTKQDAASSKQEYTLTITLSSGTPPNDLQLVRTISRPAQVVDRKLKVLVIDSLPRFDFQFMQRWLLRDRRVDARFYLTDGDKAAMRSGPPWLVELTREINGTLALERDEFRSLLFDYDLLILGDVPKRFFSREHWEVVREFVTEGGGLIHIAGRWHSPAAWAEKSIADPTARHPMADILPVEIEAVRFPIEEPSIPTPYVPVPAPHATRAALITLHDDPKTNALLWGRMDQPPRGEDEPQLKPMYWFYPVLRVKPAAEVYLVHPTARTPPPDNKPMPLLVGHYYGRGYVLFVGFDETWRWRYNTRDQYFGRFWTQAVYTAGIPRIVGTRRTQLTSNTIQPVVGTTGEIYARIYDEKYRPLLAEEITATLVQRDGDPNDPHTTTTVTFRRVPNAPGDYFAAIPYTRPGQFELYLDPRNGQPATLRYNVVYPPNHELSGGGMAETELRQLAAASRGNVPEGFYREEDLHRLPENVQPQAAAQSRREEFLLWNRWMLLLLIGLLTAEWILRKFHGLS